MGRTEGGACPGSGGMGHGEDFLKEAPFCEGFVIGGRSIWTKAQKYQVCSGAVERIMGQGVCNESQQSICYLQPCLPKALCCLTWV